MLMLQRLNTVDQCFLPMSGEPSNCLKTLYTGFYWGPQSLVYYRLPVSVCIMSLADKCQHLCIVVDIFRSGKVCL